MFNVNTKERTEINVVGEREQTLSFGLITVARNKETNKKEYYLYTIDDLLGKK